MNILRATRIDPAPLPGVNSAKREDVRGLYRFMDQKSIDWTEGVLEGGKAVSSPETSRTDEECAQKLSSCRNREEKIKTTTDDQSNLETSRAGLCDYENPFQKLIQLAEGIKRIFSIGILSRKSIMLECHGLQCFLHVVQGRVGELGRLKSRLPSEETTVARVCSAECSYPVGRNQLPISGKLNGNLAPDKDKKKKRRCRSAFEEVDHMIAKDVAVTAKNNAWERSRPNFDIALLDAISGRQPDDTSTTVPHVASREGRGRVTQVHEATSQLCLVPSSTALVELWIGQSLRATVCDSATRRAAGNLRHRLHRTARVVCRPSRRSYSLLPPRGCVGARSCRARNTGWRTHRRSNTRARTMDFYHDRPMRYPLHHGNSVTVTVLNDCFFHPSSHLAVETMMKICMRPNVMFPFIYGIFDRYVRTAHLLVGSEDGSPLGEGYIQRMWLGSNYDTQNARKSCYQSSRDETGALQYLRCGRVSGLGAVSGWLLRAANVSLLVGLPIVVRLLVSQLGEPGSNPVGFAPGGSHVGIVPDSAADRWVISGFSRFPDPCTPVLLHTSLHPPRLPRPRC
ncbi:hypothetical protein PR048_002825 [Dryococelus australis]|uniref:Uncharacterized protein n=1 Tax=Dryococelus australis TaxID=614101 RepID=A0ABQ9IL97_9NEOP|nr:hypothetical protein PR048_002825 [Dryococelus australis]